jgi:hypothetical protein
VYSQCQTHRVSHRGVFVLERVLRDRGSSSCYDGQAGVNRQSRQSYLVRLPGPVLGHVEDTHRHSRLRNRGELQLRRSLSESSRHTTHRFPEVHGQRLSACTSATCGTFPGRRFGV